MKIQPKPKPIENPKEKKNKGLALFPQEWSSLTQNCISALKVSPPWLLGTADKGPFHVVSELNGS